MALVLVVDDDDSVRLTIRCALEIGRGDLIHEARNGREALSLLDAGLAPDVILLDLMMPVMDGNEFLQAMCQRPHPPIVVFSGYLGEINPDVATIPVRLAGKPLPAEKICALVADALEPDSDL